MTVCQWCGMDGHHTETCAGFDVNDPARPMTGAVCRNCGHDDAHHDGRVDHEPFTCWHCAQCRQKAADAPPAPVVPPDPVAPVSGPSSSQSGDVRSVDVDYPNLASLAGRAVVDRPLTGGEWINLAIAEQCRDALAELDRYRAESDIWTDVVHLIETVDQCGIILAAHRQIVATDDVLADFTPVEAAAKALERKMLRSHASR